ncbi:MAG TPA: hypothetical protein PK668_27380 [Myxococcota bacterium]|nr:hypothetical protein [Myxococcota bacterium]HRY97250.1 hypothetical protein [Myxococcota bacterium]
MNTAWLWPACILSASAFLGLPGDAQAFRAYPPEHQLDPEEQQLDTSPPGQITAITVEKVHRGKGEDCNLFGCEWTEDEDMGFMILRFQPPVDDRTPVESMGYRCTQIGGNPILRFAFPYDQRGGADGRFVLNWYDGANNEQEAMDVLLQLQAIDLGGNVGPASEPIEVSDPGSGGCATSSGSALPVLSLVLLAGLWSRLRRRGLHQPS